MWQHIARQRDDALRELDESRKAEFEARAQFLLACEVIEQMERELAKSDARTLRLVRPWQPESPEAA